ncbi:MAG: PatB family C-S lyase [Chloroflexota bacterium]
MPYDFDRLIDRRHTNAIKWDAYPPDVLPMWVADMDFAAPEPVLAALRAKVEHGVFGYEWAPKELLETVANRMQKLYGWQVSTDMVVAIPGIVSGFNVAARIASQPGQGLLIQPPVYPPFLQVHQNTGLKLQIARLRQINNAETLCYEIDFEEFKAAMNAGNVRTAIFLLCQPHNPTGGIYTPQQLIRLAEICLENGTLICSDEIHSELLLGGAEFTPLATLSPEIAQRTITLVAPSKTFNVAGLFCGFAIIPNPELCKAFKQEVEHLTLHVSSLGLAAAQAAFSGECEDWLKALLAYLTENRDLLSSYIALNMPDLRTTIPDATYLAWLDCNALVSSGRISTSPYKFFLKKARVALNDGATFGPIGEGFVRFNFGCPRSTMLQALERMKAALDAIPSA